MITKRKRPLVTSKKKPVRRVSKITGKKSAKKPLLVHPRHSFKLIPHQHTSYPALVFILLLVGIFMVGWTGYVSGDDYVVNAVVPAPALTSPATILSPNDGDVFYASPIFINGGCPDNSYVKLFDNAVFSGVALCQTDNTWHIQTSLVNGSNQLSVQDYNVTDQPGPQSTAITITYVAPVIPNSPSTTQSSSSNSSSSTRTSTSSKSPSLIPLIVSSDFTYKAFYAGQPATETFTISGGYAPYAVSVDWGDGTDDLSSHATAGQINLSHVYKKPGGYDRSYTIIIKVSDAKGQSSLLQLLTIISAQQTGSGSSALRKFGIGSSTSSGTPPSPYATFWRKAGPTYAVTLIAASSFWLGEHHEIELVRHAIKRTIKRPRRV